MAVRVRVRIVGEPGRTVETVAVLNGGFEVPEPHLLLPARCAERLFADFRRGAARQEMTAAGGTAEFYSLQRELPVRACALGREGPEAQFRVLVSDADHEVLISDGGIDALSLRVESFLPGRWRFADETHIRDAEAPQYW